MGGECEADANLAPPCYAVMSLNFLNYLIETVSFQSGIGKTHKFIYNISTYSIIEKLEIKV